MMEVLLVSIFTKEVIYGNGRLGNLMKWLPKDTHFTLLASDYDHRNKKYYDDKRHTFFSDNGVENYYIHIPSYNKNLSFKRIWGNYVFGRGVKKFLKNTHKEYDLIYCIVPSANGVLGCRQYKSSHKTKMVIDVMDLLPESLFPIVGDNIITRLVLWPWSSVSRKAYKTADFITGESKEYSNIAHICNPDVPYTYTYLGINMSRINNILNNSSLILRNDGGIKICYGGNLGNSYDFELIFDALAKMRDRGVSYTMYFVGGGDREEYVKSKIDETGINAIITGIVPYETYIEYMSHCDIGLNIFKKDTKIVHSYKFNDYAACGLYIVNNLHGETEDMINEYDCGITNDNLFEALYEICLSWDTIKEKKANSKRLVEAELESNIIYKKQTDKILAMLNG